MKSRPSRDRLAARHDAGRPGCCARLAPAVTALAVAALLAAPAAMAAEPTHIKATIDGVEQIFPVTSSNIVKEIVPAPQGSGYVTNWHVKNGQTFSYDALNYPFPSGSVRVGAQDATDGPAYTAQGVELKFSSTNTLAVVESISTIIQPRYGSVSTYNGVVYPPDITRNFWYNFALFPLEGDAVRTERLNLTGSDVEGRPSSIPGRRFVQSYDTLNLNLCESPNGDKLTWDHLGEGRYLGNADLTANMVFRGGGYVFLMLLHL